MADTTQSFFGTPAVAFITGASKGIGRAIAIEFARRFSEGLLLVLTGRSEKDLQETASLIKADSSFLSSKMTVRCVVGDLQNQATIQNLIERLFENIDPSQYQHAILVNNAASTGDVSKYVRDFGLNDVKELQDYVFLNVNCPLILVSKFLSIFSSTIPDTSEKGPSKITIIQLSSNAALVPIKGWSMYCTGKAARAALHKIIAAEEPNVRVLSFSPGPVATDMLRYSRDNTRDPDTSRMTRNSYERSVQPIETVTVMCQVLEEDKYESGAHVSFTDIVGPPKNG